MTTERLRRMLLYKRYIDFCIERELKIMSEALERKCNNRKKRNVKANRQS